jgi:hypothetical protein
MQHILPGLNNFILNYASVKATKYCDEFTSKCHPCTSEVRCFCRHYNKEVSLLCLNLAGSGRNYLQLLNYEGKRQLYKT